MARLGVNVNCVAALRATGKNSDPDPAAAVVFAEVGGADGIVCPLVEELHPLTERDVRLLREIVKTHLNLQIPPTDKMVTLALSNDPDMVTLVPGKKPGSTPGGGLDVLGRSEELASVIQDIRGKGIVVSLLVEPIIHQVKAAAKVGADYVELHMGQFSKVEDLNERADILENISSVVLASSKLGLGVAAGHGLNYQNVGVIAAMEKVEEINIGHAIAVRALWLGMENAVRDMAALVH
ncbi:MAG: pyridoxine 5'-phosphate synthase [bacterium]